jgi:hypothetical protein
MIDGEQATSAFISAVLEAIGEISNVDAESVKPYMGDLLPLILECIKDQSSAQKREVAIKTLVSIIENTGFVIKPYFFYPEILQYVRNLVQNEQSTSIKRLVFKLIGTIGALDPYLVKQIQLYYNASSDGSLDPSADVHANIPPLLRMIDQHHFVNNAGGDGSDFQGPQSAIERNILKKKYRVDFEVNRQMHAAAANKNEAQDPENAEGGQNNLVVKDMPMIQFYSQLGARGQEMIKYLKKYDFQEKKENKYPTKAIQHLVKVLLDPTLRDHHEIVLQGMSYIVKHLGPDCVEFLPVIIPPLVILIKTNDFDLIIHLY